MNKKNVFIFFSLCFLCPAFGSDLKLEWQHYTSAPAFKSQMKDYLFLSWDQKTDFYTGSFYINMRFQTEYNLNQSQLFYFNLSELYLSYKYKFKSFPYFDLIEFSLGRKAKDWSLADAYWGMGLWNSMNRWNPLHPKSNGLIGSFLTLQSKKWSFDFLLGGLYLPNKEPVFQYKNGKAYSSSRWFQPLPDQVDVFGLSYLNIYYLIDTPFLFDILFQQSYLLSLKTWSKTKEAYYWMKWSFADKPVNHLFFVLKENEIFKIGKEEDSEGVVRQPINTLPVRERIFSAEWGVDYKNLSAIFTLENTKRREERLSPENWDFVNQRESVTYFSSLVKYYIFSKNFIQLGYLHSWFANYNSNLNQLQKKKPPSVLGKYRILDGISLEGQTEFVSSKGLKRELALKYQYSFLNEGAWLSFKALYYISPRIYTSATLDILGAKDYQTDFLYRFQHNDYYSWGLTYVF